MGVVVVVVVVVVVDYVCLDRKCKLSDCPPLILQFFVHTHDDAVYLHFHHHRRL